MIIDCISDLHGYYPELKGGDLLIVAGDLTLHNNSENEMALFDYWLDDQNYKKKILVAGNHDYVLFENRIKLFGGDYLCDSGTEFEGFKIWGSPWTKKFDGMNPDCMAFTVNTEEELAEKWALIPDDTDILITHSPIKHYLDKIENLFTGNIERVGSFSLGLTTKEMSIANGAPIKLHVCGHIHEGYGQTGDGVIIHRVNASLVNEHYQPVNKPIRIEL